MCKLCSLPVQTMQTLLKIFFRADILTIAGNDTSVKAGGLNLSAQILAH